jgi:NAD(P)-dependent dehydrogenase (short-subunit alcohol dehydrogenase family)
MDFTTTTALVTGANRGLGKALTEALLERGAKVYAGARRPETVTTPGAIPVRIDFDDPASIEEAARVAGDVDLLINNAGSSTESSLLAGDDDVRRELEVHVLGPLAVTRAFTPVLERNGGGTILNILSVLSWIGTTERSAYAAAKAAEWSLTNSLRLELADQGIRVAGLHVGYMDTDLVTHVTAPKSDPREIAQRALDGLEAGAYEIVADDLSAQVKRALAADPTVLYPALA